MTDQITTSSRTIGFATTTATITVYAKPTATLTDGDTICQGGEANIEVSITGTGSTTITLNDGTNKTFDLGTSTTTITTVTGTITVKPNTTTHLLNLGQ